MQLEMYGVGQNIQGRFTIVSMKKTIFVLLFINYRIIFHRQL